MTRSVVRFIAATVVAALLGMLPACSDEPVGPQKTPPATTHKWSQRFGDRVSQQAQGVATDASGNVVAVGYFGGTMDFGGGPLTSAGAEDIFVAKFDAGGNHVWSKRFGDANSQIGLGVTTDGSNIVIVGSFLGSVNFGGAVLTDAGQTDIFVVKLDADGNHVWSKRFGDGSFQSASSVAVDLVGNVVIGGRFLGTVDFGGGNITNVGQFADVYVAKFSPTGMHIWSKGFGGSQSDNLGGVAIDNQGNVVIAGNFNDAIDFGGGVIASRGVSDVYVAKMNTNGVHLWSQGFGDNMIESAAGVATDSQRSIVVTGYFFGSIDFGGGAMTSTGTGDIFLAKFNEAGLHLWSRRFGDSSDQDGIAVAVDGSDNVAMTGTFQGSVDFGGGSITSAGGLDIFLARFTSSGSHTKSESFGDANDQHATGVAYDAQGNLNLVGYFAGSVDFGGGTLTSAGLTDVYCAQFTP